MDSLQSPVPKSKKKVLRERSVPDSLKEQSEVKKKGGKLKDNKRSESKKKDK